MAKHSIPRPRNRKSTVAPKKASAPAKGGKAVIGTASYGSSASQDLKHDHDDFFRDNFFHRASSNRFWLEPELYTGPTVTSDPGDSSLPPTVCASGFGSLTGKCAPHGGIASSFPAGSEALQFDKNGAPIWRPDTERLVGRTKTMRDTLLTLCMDEAHQPTELHIRAEKEESALTAGRRGASMNLGRVGWLRGARRIRPCRIRTRWIRTRWIRTDRVAQLTGTVGSG